MWVIVSRDHPGHRDRVVARRIHKDQSFRGDWLGKVINVHKVGDAAFCCRPQGLLQDDGQ